MCCIGCCLNVIMQTIIFDHGAMAALCLQLQTDEDETSFTDLFLKICFSVVYILYFTSILCFIY